MIKKIFLGAALTLVTGALITGAVIRTNSKAAEQSSLLQTGRGNTASGEVERSYQNGGGGGNAGNTGSSNSGNGGDADRSRESISVEGSVASVDEESLLIVTLDGEEIRVEGRAWLYAQEQGFWTEAGNTVILSGVLHEETGEFSVVEIRDMTLGTAVLIRGESGQALWAGSGGNGSSESSGQGGSGRQGDQSKNGEGIAAERVSLEGTVASVDTESLLVVTTEGEEMLVEGRAWLYAQEQGFWTAVGNTVVLSGAPCEESGGFDVAEISDLTAGTDVLVRSESGQPLWSGSGRSGSASSSGGNASGGGNGYRGG